VLVVEHTSDNNLMAFRYKFTDVKMKAAEADFDLSGRKFRAGAFIIPNADRHEARAGAGPIRPLGLGRWRRSRRSRATISTCQGSGSCHAWQRTQDEGWIRAALDTYGVPYTYFSDQKLAGENLRAKYDVIVYPHVGGTPQSHVNGIPKVGDTKLPYRKTDATPNLGALDESDDIRGGMGLEGLRALTKFVEDGGTLIVEGSTVGVWPEYGITPAITVESPDRLFARGSILRGMITDKASPIMYGYEGSQLPVYFNQDPVINVNPNAAFAAFFGGGSGGAAAGQNVTPMSAKLKLSPWAKDSAAKPAAAAPAPAPAAPGGQQLATAPRPRVIMQFPANADDMLLSGTLAGGEALANRAQVVDAPVGQGHIVMFAIRPFWRWQTQGTFFLGFNAILNWNDLECREGGRPLGRSVTLVLKVSMSRSLGVESLRDLETLRLRDFETVKEEQ
jgi:hypothetical protein